MNEDSWKSKILKSALQILDSETSGIRVVELERRIASSLPGSNPNTIASRIWDLDKTKSGDVLKPERGFFILKKYYSLPTPGGPQSSVPKNTKIVDEDLFYEPFANWLKDMDECTDAISLGGKAFGDKWGTPDVIGIRKTGRIIESKEVISAEVKVDSSQLVTAFGQACAYRLFSHKVYLVVPNEITEKDESRIDALCRLFGIGLILFDAKEPTKPEFEIRARPQRFEPDLFYTNYYLENVAKQLHL